MINTPRLLQALCSPSAKLARMGDDDAELSIKPIPERSWNCEVVPGPGLFHDQGDMVATFQTKARRERAIDEFIRQVIGQRQPRRHYIAAKDFDPIVIEHGGTVISAIRAVENNQRTTRMSLDADP